LDQQEAEIRNIKKDIELSGFPLEIQVSSILRNKNWGVQNQAYYLDKEKKIARSVDVIGNKGLIEPIGNYDRLHVSLIIECKRSPSKPWVFYTSQRDPRAIDLESIGVLKFFEYTNNIFSKRPFIDWIVNSCHYSTDYTDFAVNWYEPYKKGKGRAIKTAVHQVTKATNYNLEEMKDVYEKLHGRTSFRPFFLRYSVIVFDGKMYECIPQEKDIEVRRRSSFLYSYGSHQKINFIDILEIGLLEKYVERIDREISDLKQALAQST